MPPIPERLLTEFARRFDDAEAARFVLAKAGVERGTFPALGSTQPRVYWERVFDDLAGGLVKGVSADTLVTAAAKLWEDNAVFPQFLPPDPAAPRRVLGVMLVVHQEVDYFELRDAAAHEVARLNLPCTVSLGAYTAGWVTLELADAQHEHGVLLRHAVCRVLPLSVDAVAITPMSRHDSLRDQVVIGFPDGTRIELPFVPTSVTYRELGRLITRLRRPRPAATPAQPTGAVVVAPATPPPVTRYLIGRLTGRLADGEPVTLQVRVAVAGEPGCPCVLLESMPPGGAADIRVRLDAAGFECDTEPEQRLTVPAAGDSRYALFQLRPVPADRRNILVSASYDGRLLGQLSCDSPATP